MKSTNNTNTPKQSLFVLLFSMANCLQAIAAVAAVKWDAETLTYSGSAKVIGGEPFVITLVGNHHTANAANASTGKATLATTPENLTRLTIQTDANAEVKWSVIWSKGGR